MIKDWIYYLAGRQVIFDQEARGEESWNEVALQTLEKFRLYVKEIHGFD